MSFFTHCAHFSSYPFVIRLPLPSYGLCSVTVCVQISPLYKDTIYLRLRPTLMTSFQCNYLFKDPIPKYSHILKYWGLGLQHTNSEWAQFSPSQGDGGGRYGLQSRTNMGSERSSHHVISGSHLHALASVMSIMKEDE